MWDKNENTNEKLFTRPRHNRQNIVRRHLLRRGWLTLGVDHDLITFTWPNLAAGIIVGYIQVRCNMSAKKAHSANCPTRTTNYSVATRNEKRSPTQLPLIIPFTYQCAPRQKLEIVDRGVSMFGIICRRASDVEIMEKGTRKRKVVQCRSPGIAR